jgi:hypothetical protein
MAEGKRSGLVEHNCSGSPHLLESRTGLHDDTQVSRPTDSRDHRDRRSQNERTWRRDDEYRQNACRVSREAHATPHITSVSGVNHTAKRSASRWIGGFAPRLLYQPDDLWYWLPSANRSARIRSVRSRPTLRRAAACLDCADRERLTGERRLINGGCAVGHLAVHRNEVPRPDQELVANLDLAHGNFFHLPVAYPETEPWGAGQ